jgi:hypothetical protein
MGVERSASLDLIDQDVVVGGIGTLLIVALWMKYFPALAQRQQLTKAVS